MKNLNLLLLFVLVCAFTGAGCLASKHEERVENFGDRIPTSEEIVEALQPPVPGKINAAAQRVAISLAINFEKDSFELTAKTTKVLDILGQAIASEKLKDFKFLLEGHTDASGSEEYNMELSQRRADTVRDYMVKKHDINPARLATSGKGESELLDETDPIASANRRVKIINEGY